MRVLSVVRRSPIVFPLACAAVLAMVIVSEGSYWRSVDTLDTLGSVATARLHIQTLTQGILEAEAGQRNYLLTGRKEYLEPYQQAIERIRQSFQFLEQYYGDKPKSREVLTKLRTVASAKLSELSETLRLLEDGKHAAATELVSSNIGKEKLEATRQLGSELLAQEAARVQQGRTDVYQTLMLNRVGVSVLSVLSLLALFMYLRQTTELENHQMEQQRLALAESQRLEAEVAQRTAQLTELANHLQTAREDERHRLARELHDELGALLTSAKLDAARIKSRLGDSAPEAMERLVHLIGTLNSGIALGRRIIEDLRPSTLANLGLVATLEILLRDFSERSGVKTSSALEPVQLDADAQLTVYRVVQEAIANVIKYAKAGHVWVHLTQQAGMVELSVRDDGVGFDAAMQPRSAYGLVGMRFRVEAEGGTLSLDSTPGQGTLIRMRLPESRPQPSANA